MRLKASILALLLSVSACFGQIWFQPEPYLGLPSLNDQVLVSTTLGVRAWKTLSPVSHFSFTIYADGDWASESVPVWQAPKDMAITIVQVNATVTGTGTPTLAYNIEEVAWGGLASAGTDVFSADVTAVAAGLESTSFNNAGIAAKAHLVFTTGAAPDSGTVSLITVTVYYTRVVE